MSRYYIELTKHIVVEVEADDETGARTLAVDNENSWDGAWERAEPQVVDVFDIRQEPV